MKNKYMSLGVTWGQLVALLLLFLVSTGQVLAVELVASVDRNPVSINESFKLIIRASESPGDDPDFSPLNKDFEIINQQQSSRSSWVNGQSSKIISWDLDVMAKRVGQLQIPSINFGGDKTKPITLQVVENQVQAASGESEALYLDVSVSTNEVYVQAQLIYTVRLFQRVSLAKASLTEPQADNLMVEKLGEDSQFNTQVNGVNYTVTERKYAIFPQKSGPLTIAPLTLTAQIASQNRSAYGSIFNSQRTQTKRVYSKAIPLNVLAAPTQLNTKHWLAAEQLHIEQSWSNNEPSITVGEPLTRTLTLLAKGVTASQLPEFILNGENASLKVYPDQAVLKNQRNNDGVIAFREQKIALIPSKPGEYTLNAIEIPWFNTQTGLQEMASIAPTTITVLAKQGVSSNETLAVTRDEFVELPTVIDKPQVTKIDNNWKWLALGLGLGWLLTLLYIVFKATKTKAIKQAEAPQAYSAKVLIKELKTACEANQAQQAKQVLLQWMQLQYQQDNFDHISELFEPELVDQINTLNHCLYGNNATSWDGSRLAQLVISQMACRGVVDKGDGGLEPLHRL